MPTARFRRTKTVYANRDPRLTATVVYNGYVWKDRNDKGEYVTKGTINVTSGNDKAGTDNGSPTASTPASISIRPTARTSKCGPISS